MARFGTNASGATISWRDNLSSDAIPWVRCASGNVCRKCRIYALFCRKCRDYAPFRVEFYAEFLAEILRNMQNFGRNSAEEIGGWSLCGPLVARLRTGRVKIYYVCKNPLSLIHI